MKFIKSDDQNHTTLDERDAVTKLMHKMSSKSRKMPPPPPYKKSC